MANKLLPGRNELHKFIGPHIDLANILVQGRYLQADCHDWDCGPNDHMHLYRKILKDWDPKTKTVLLSKKGSRRLIKNLDTPDKNYSLNNLHNEGLYYWMLRETDHKLF